MRPAVPVSSSALATLKRAAAAEPERLDLAMSLGAGCWAAGRAGEARRVFEQIVARHPNHAQALVNLGVIALTGGARDAGRYFRAALAVDPDCYTAHANLAQDALLRADFATGWPAYERRFEAPELAPFLWPGGPPRWTGAEELGGRRILITREQGHGDMIQFLRYASPMAARGAEVFVETAPALAALFARAPGVSRVVTARDAAGRLDFHIPYLSLPGAFATELASVPAPVPYLRPHPLVEPPDGLPASPRIGLVWAGGRENSRDAERSIPLVKLKPLLGRPGIVSLQRDLRPGDEKLLMRYPAIIRAGESLDDFDRLATLVTALDLVITVDTAVAHLAGALGKPVWLLIPPVPDWRWMWDRPDSPWYPSARLFRRAIGEDWAAVVARVARALDSDGVPMTSSSTGNQARDQPAASAR
jgi:Tetratricopeptide repeat/Glycosyltransferase family 9 (heptosyltransferase)